MALVTIRNILSLATTVVILAGLCFGLLPVAQAHKYDMSIFRTYFGCGKCDQSACKEPINCEFVREAGICSCCLTCARLEGESCGINVPKCAAGLICNPPMEALNGFEALMNGKGVCESAIDFHRYPFARRSVRARDRQSKLSSLTRW